MADSLSDKETHSPGDRHQLLVHVSAETLVGQSSAAVPEGSSDGEKVNAETPFHPETLRRLACDGGKSIVPVRPEGTGTIEFWSAVIGIRKLLVTRS